MKKYLVISLVLGTITSLFFLVKHNPSWFVKPKTTIPQTGIDYTGKNKIQVALILDTSNSMDGLIEQAKSQLWKLINELSDMEKEGETPDIEIALYQYGNNHLSIRKGYTEQILPFTTDLDELSKQLFILTTNGGDEYCAWAINTAIKELKWSDNPADLKLIFIAGNERFNQGAYNYLDVCANAKNQGILINTIHCGDYQEGINTFWQKGAAAGGGRYLNINQNEEVTHFSTPYDEKVIELNQQLNDTYISYGKLGKVKFENLKLQDFNATTYADANAVSRTFSKTKPVYSNESWDLVDYTKKNKLSKLEKKALPKEMQKMTTTEQETFVKEKKDKREDIKRQLKELEVKVKAYKLEKHKASAKAHTLTLDNVMIQTITEQAEAKAFRKSN